MILGRGVQMLLIAVEEGWLMADERGELEAVHWYS